jgi:protein-S-isoprenylcysteine O-methyltransferase Ste14
MRGRNAMRRPAALGGQTVSRRRALNVAGSVAWFVTVGGLSGWVLPYLAGDWHFHPAPLAVRIAGGILIGAGLVPLIWSFADFIGAGGTPVPVASPPRLVVTGFYRYVRNPIYVGFLVTLGGEVLLFWSPGLLRYTLVACAVGVAAVRWYEEPVLARKFGADYAEYRRAVRAWVPRTRPWTASSRSSP